MIKNTIKGYIRPIYFRIIPFIKRLPIYLIRALNLFPIRLFNYEKVSLIPPEEICELTYSWFIKVSQKASYPVQYIKVDEHTISPRNNFPKTADDVRSSVFLDETDVHQMASFVVSIPKGRVWGEYGAIVTEDNILLADISLCRLKGFFGGKNRLYTDWHLCKIKKLEGSVAVLATDSANLYYHWMADLLLRYGLLLRAGFTLDSFDNLVIGSYAKRFQAETLEILGLKDKDAAKKLVQTSQYPHIQADRLIVPSYPAIGANFQTWQIEFLRNAFIPKDKSGSQSVLPKRRIYISRGDAAYRKVVNEAEVITVLAKYGFEAVQLAPLSFRDQVDLMVSAEAIAGPHGGGLTNIMFCSPGTKVIEFFSPEMVAIHFWRIADRCGLDYYYTVGDRLRSESYDQTWNARADILVSIDRLYKTLKLSGLAD